MPLTSAGILLYKRDENDGIKVFLVHPGGPYFTKKDKGWWGIPKGLPNENEDVLAAAKREFAEETGYLPQGEFISLGEVKLKSGKIVHAWAVEDDFPANWKLKCNTFKIEWPPKSGKYQSFPEIDQGRFFKLDEAKAYINEAQKAFLERLEAQAQPEGK